MPITLPQPPPQLAFHGPGLEDFRIAQAGQWFLGLVDTGRMTVYLAPSIPEAVRSETAARLNQVNVGLPEGQTWSSLPRPWAGINAPGAAEFETAAGAPSSLTHHGRVAALFGVQPRDALGFSLIKGVDGSAIYIDKSNSMNADKVGARHNPAGGWHMPIAWNDRLVADLRAVVPLQAVDTTECHHADHTVTLGARA